MNIKYGCVWKQQISHVAYNYFIKIVDGHWQIELQQNSSERRQQNYTATQTLWQDWKWKSSWQILINGRSYLTITDVKRSNSCPTTQNYSLNRVIDEIGFCQNSTWFWSYTSCKKHESQIKFYKPHFRITLTTII